MKTAGDTELHKYQNPSCEIHNYGGAGSIKKDSESLSAKRQAGKNVVIAGKFSGITFGNPRISGGVVK